MPMLVKNSKKRKALGIWIILLSLLTAIFLYFLNHRIDTEESMTYFPEDTQMHFKTRQTTLAAKNQKHSAQLLWTTLSKTATPSYLRQDVSLLYKNGRLISILKKWGKNTDVLEQQKHFTLHNTGYYETITAHYAETHYPHDIIKSKTKMSYEHLAIMGKNRQSWDSFHLPITRFEIQWNSQLTHTLQKQNQTLLKQAVEKYQIPVQEYDVFPLTHLHIFDYNTLPGLNKKNTHRVVSQLWEGLYNHYILGIEHTHHDRESAIGSHIPLILYHKNADKLLVVIKTTQGHLVLLKQSF